MGMVSSYRIGRFINQNTRMEVGWTDGCMDERDQGGINYAGFR